MKKLLFTLLFFSTFSLVGAQVAKSVSILGDSYSTFEGYLTPDSNAIFYSTKKMPMTDVYSVTQTWWHKFIKDNGYKFCVNNSFSGATICNTGYNKQDYSDRSFVRRYKNLGHPDIIFIFGGINDAWANAPIGEFKYADWTKQDLYSYRQALAYLLCNMTEYYPNVKIYFLINDVMKSDFEESTKTICDHYGIKYIVLKDIDKKTLHPTVKGMEQIVEQMNAALAVKAPAKSAKQVKRTR